MISLNTIMEQIQETSEFKQAVTAIHEAIVETNDEYREADLSHVCLAYVTVVLKKLLDPTDAATYALDFGRSPFAGTFERLLDTRERNHLRHHPAADYAEPRSAEGVYEW